MQFENEIPHVSSVLAVRSSLLIAEADKTSAFEGSQKRLNVIAEPEGLESQTIAFQSFTEITRYSYT